MIGVVGAGAMGGALAVQLVTAGNEVTILATPYDAPFVNAHLNGEPHPALGVPLPDVTIVDPDSWRDVLGDLEMLVLAVATAGLVPTVQQAAPFTSGDCLWAIATKGWDEETLRPAAAVVADELGDPARVVAVVGPSLAKEIAIGVPTAVVCASSSKDSARRVAELFDSERFRTYVSDDVPGVEVGAIMKNVVAIAAGMCDGLADSFCVESMTNAKAFVFSRGLVEMAAMARALGGKPETILGLAGAGDLFVTVLGGRNGKFGRLIGAGKSPQDALEEMNTTVEGYMNARAAAVLAEKLGLELAVVDVVAKVVHYGMAPKEAIERLVGGSVEEEL